MGDIDMKALREPFPDEVVKTKPGRGQGGKPLSYISHALVTERLNEVDPAWEMRTIEEHIYYDGENRPHCAGVTIALTVGGVTRHEAGGPQRVEMFANEIKNAYSDALKRAAMRFGVALYIWDSLVDAEGDEDARGEPQRMDDRQGREVEAQHQRNTAPAPSTLPVTRSPAGQRQQPDGQDRARANVEEKCRAKGVPVPDGATYALIAENVNKALFAAGKDVEVNTDARGQVKPGDILNALLALPELAVKH